MMRAKEREREKEKGDVHEIISILSPKTSFSSDIFPFFKVIKFNTINRKYIFDTLKRPSF